MELAVHPVHPAPLVGVLTVLLTVLTPARPIRLWMTTSCKVVFWLRNPGKVGKHVSLTDLANVLCALRLPSRNARHTYIFRLISITVQTVYRQLYRWLETASERSYYEESDPLTFQAIIILVMALDIAALIMKNKEIPNQSIVVSSENIILPVCQDITRYTRNEEVYMDDEENCLRNIRNDDMNEGDLYAVNSDSWHGESPWTRRPAECSIATNFGDRLASVQITQWWCEKNDGEPFLAIYDSCNGERENLLARYDCSSSSPSTLYSSGTCITLYHYRGHTRWRYYFALQIVAKYEVIAFPAGGIAAIIIAVIVVVMIVVKIVCLVSGFENRLPAVPVESEDIKQTLLVDGAAASGSRRNSREKSETRTTPPSARGGTARVTEVTTTTGTRRTVMLSSLQGHTLLRATTSSPTSSPGPSRDAAQDHAREHVMDVPDGSDPYSTQRTTRFIGVRAPRILKL